MGSALRIIGGVVCSFVALLEALLSPATATPPILEQRVRSSFQPSSAFLLYPPVRGKVVSQQALVVPSFGQEYLVGTEAIAVSEQLEGGPPFCFFLKGRDASFAATPVRLEHSAASTRPVEDLERELTSIEEKKVRSSARLGELRMRLSELRSQAMQVGGVDTLIQLQTELNRIKNADARRDNEQARLKELIALGRKEKEIQGLDELRQQLSGALRDTAQATALADRLKTRKKQAAKQGLEEKLQLIREAQSYNREELAREILALRAKRKQLEAERLQQTGEE